MRNVTTKDMIYIILRLQIYKDFLWRDNLLIFSIEKRWLVLAKPLTILTTVHGQMCNIMVEWEDFNKRRRDQTKSFWFTAEIYPSIGINIARGTTDPGTYSELNYLCTPALLETASLTLCICLSSYSSTTISMTAIRSPSQCPNNLHDPRHQFQHSMHLLHHLAGPLGNLLTHISPSTCCSTTI